MVKSPYKPGDQVLLANPNTRFRMNGIPAEHWGKVWTIDRYDSSFDMGITMQHSYWLDVNGRSFHVIDDMLSLAGGPW